MAEPKIMSYLQDCVLQCSLCNEEFKTPRTLDCLHTFCLPCLEEHISQTQTGDKFPCPTCKCEETVPEDGAESLDSSHIQLSINQVSKFMQAEDTMCTSCAENSAETACYNCGEFLCPDCEEKHSILKATKDHRVCPIGDLKNRDNLVKFQRERFDNCGKHGDLKKLYCKKCNVDLCNVCVYDDNHQKHDVTSIHGKVDDEIKMVEKKMEVLSKDQEGHQANIDILQDKLTCVQSGQAEVIASIDGYVQQMHELLDTYKAAMVDHMTSHTTNQTSDIQSKIFSHQNQLNRKVLLCKGSTILEELPLGSILPASQELLKKLERCKRPYSVSRQQLDKSNPEQNFVGRDLEMPQVTIENCFKSLVGFTIPLPPSAKRETTVIDTNLKELAQKQAIENINSVITQLATSPRNNATFEEMAKKILEKWMEKQKSEWKCAVGAPGLHAIAGFIDKKSNLHVEIEGIEFLLFELW